jgi:hypothetical protein
VLFGLIQTETRSQTETPSQPKSRRLLGALPVALAVVAVILLAATGAFSGSSTVGKVQLHLTAATTPAGGTPNAQQDPFGAPSGPNYSVPQPPGETNLVPTFTTKTTTRLYGSNPFEEAVSVTQHIWPAALAENAPGGNDNVPDRPRAVTLLTPDDPLTAITATPLVHFPDDAPVLYVNRTGIPAVTANEIKRLGTTGIARYHNVDAFLVGGAANPGVEKQLAAMGVKYVTVTAPDIPALANTVDQLYGSIQNPDNGVPAMGGGVTTSGGPENVMIGSMQGKDYQYLLPATHWVAHMATGLFWVDRNSVPAATIQGLQRRGGKANIYLFGGPQQISEGVAKQLSQYGNVVRIDNNDNVAFNSNPTDNPIDTAIVFSKMWDPGGMVGWKMTGPGHGFTLVNINDWQGAVASSPLSHLGFHAPLLITNGGSSLPPELTAYFSSVAPTFTNSPADGPYNMTYVIGSWNQINWGTQAHVDAISEMGNRRMWNTATGGGYNDSQPSAS